MTSAAGDALFAPLHVFHCLLIDFFLISFYVWTPFADIMTSSSTSPLDMVSQVAVVCDIAADLQNLFEVWQEESSREPDITWSMESASTEDDEPRRGWSKRGTIHKPGSRTSLRARGRGRSRAKGPAGMAPLITWRKYRVRPRDNALYRAYMADPYWRKQK
jgi:hypothetical protein